MIRKIKNELNSTSLSILSALYEREGCTRKMLCVPCFLPKQTVHTAVTACYKKGWIRMEER
ncbi:MarR family transcriptional regulator [Megasphaera sp.]|uniref:MarR family transcriptional regulator n=1 Tax=Megasphaera sp. TaxID=2023260 RepID=UPI00359FBDF0